MENETTHHTDLKPPIHPLKRWLFEHQIPQTEFADVTGVSQSYLSELVTWRKRPSLDVVEVIKAATGGEITAEHFTRGPRT
jgi:predicted transcriptional regulator